MGPFLRSKEQGSQALSEGDGPRWRKIVQLWDQLCVSVLYRMADYTPEHSNYVFQLVVPKSQQDEVLSRIHKGVGGGHLGAEKSVAKLRSVFTGQDIIMM